MRIPSTIGRSGVGINLTPMIDVVFQLIIFFLVSSHLSKQEAQMTLPLPTANSGEKQVESDVRRLTLNILANGQLSLAGHPIPFAQLQPRLADAVRKSQGKIEVRIRGDRNVPYRFVEPLLTACARAGVWDVQFSVYRTEDVR